jgi:hypothetical protein
MADTARCEEIREVLPELAAGVAAGDTRAGALAHLAGCPGCRRELEELSTVFDGLLLLAPEHEPSPGFESSVLAAMAPPRRGSRRRMAALVAAAATVLAAGVVVGVAWERSTGRPDLVAAEVTAAQGTAGRAFAYEGERSWVYLSLDSAPRSGRYLVRVVTADDRTLDIGWCEVRDGKGSWGWAVDVPADELRALQLVRGGSVAMSADFG